MWGLCSSLQEQYSTSRKTFAIAMTATLLVSIYISCSKVLHASAECEICEAVATELDNLISDQSTEVGIFLILFKWHWW